ncbi:beta-class carbonic anhydrase [Paenibacillus thermoaerophilus]|uniref:carbonic anhydrase n=1 Tax=Paenibacillus thermoaerophilus TaxID=1215385 RepID=A0ABW2V6K0_9BACL|nr:carbonic anhydrase [Paenibacillus thermoaerophilus]TMV16201.1 carbonic anhydrase [Paenibacillus thermoaerophilus]
MSIVPSLLEFNRKFVEEKQYEAYMTDKYPDKKVAVLTCMDTRLVELLPKALGFKNGDAKFIKNAGGILTQPFGSAMRSILVAVYELGAREVLVIGHHGCGMTNLDAGGMVRKFAEHGIDPLAIETLENAGIRMEKFLRGFGSAEEGVMHSVRMIRKHPLFPKAVPVSGFVIDPVTGALEVIVEDYREEP